jgi:hypothetical protein
VHFNSNHFKAHRAFQVALEKVSSHLAVAIRDAAVKVEETFAAKEKEDLTNTDRERSEEHQVGTRVCVLE